VRRPYRRVAGEEQQQEPAAKRGVPVWPPTCEQATSARLAQAQGDNKAAIASFEEAVALQDGLPYTEPPFWYYPMRQTLAAALLQAGRLDEAEAQFKRALERALNNGWLYYGLPRVNAAQGDAAAAKQAEKNLAKTWIGNPVVAAAFETVRPDRKASRKPRP
jgi:tetratricopeptide (TPR) repeat protein